MAPYQVETFPALKYRQSGEVTSALRLDPLWFVVILAFGAVSEKRACSVLQRCGIRPSLATARDGVLGISNGPRSPGSQRPLALAHRQRNREDEE